MVLQPPRQQENRLRGHGRNGDGQLSDACATLAVLISTFIARFTGVNIDAYAGALVALLILWGGYNAAKDTITPLLGRAPDRNWCAAYAL